MNKRMIGLAIGGLVAGGVMGCAAFGGKDSGQVKMKGADKVTAKAEAKGIEKKSKSKQAIATSQPVTAGRDARNISPVITINGDNSGLVICLLAAGGLVVGLKFWQSWAAKGKALQVMMSAIEEQDDGRVQKAVAQKSYKAGVSQVIYDHLQAARKRDLKTHQTAGKEAVKAGQA